MPTVKCIEPEEAYPGQTVTLIGENLRDNLQVMFGSSVAFNSKVISPNAMRVIVPPRSSAGLVEVSLACKENNRNFCKLSTSVTFRYSSPNELELNFSRLQDIIYRISKDPIKMSKEVMLKKANDILEKICQNSIFQQIGLQALADVDLTNNSLVNSSSTNSTGSNSSLNSSGSVSSINSRMNINASLPSNLNNLISNTNMMMSNVHNNQLAHHLNSSHTNTGSPVSNNSVNQLSLMSNNLTNNLSINSNSNSSSGTNSNNSTPTQMINTINHNSINHNALKYENAYQNSVSSSSSNTNHMINNNIRNVPHHHHTTGSYLSSQNMQSSSNILNTSFMNPFTFTQAVGQPYLYSS